MNSAGSSAFGIQQFCQAKIEDLGLTRRRDHHVAGFDVAMNDSARVRGGQRVGHLDGNRKRAAQIEGAAVDKLTHILAFDELHRDEVDAADLVEIEDSADVGMVERRSETGFALKSLDVGFFDCQLRR